MKNVVKKVTEKVKKGSTLIKRAVDEEPAVVVHAMFLGAQAACLTIQLLSKRATRKLVSDYDETLEEGFKTGCDYTEDKIAQRLNAYLIGTGKTAEEALNMTNDITNCLKKN
jgi:hypothetical protein